MSIESTAQPRTAVVTGASSGIGRATAVALAGLGWNVALGARRVDALEETALLVCDAGGTPCAHELDVADAASVDTFFDAVEDTLGPVDALVNNAGIAVPGPFAELDPADLEREVRTNLLGPMLCTRRALGSMLPRGAGDIVFISSDAARVPRPRLLGYSATKAGLEVVARTLTMELEGSGVRSTTVRVGPTLTDFASGWDAERLAELMGYWPRFGIQRHFATLRPEDVAGTIVFALTAPPGVHVDTLEVQPEAPRSE